ncbi:MAG: hypothetical protein HYZ16_00080 [Bacteroidetes bacterium]|nr:hypothetical protein [Bacteroidota bacterium]
MNRPILIVASLALVTALVAWLVFRSNPSTLVKVEGGAKQPKETVEVILGLKTCEVCGYDALKEAGMACMNCGYAINQQTMAQEMLADEHSLVIQYQLDYFLPDTLGSPIHFMKPRVSKKGYPKSATWKPLVFESEVFEYHKVITELEQARTPGKPQ